MGPGNPPNVTLTQYNPAALQVAHQPPTSEIETGVLTQMSWNKTRGLLLWAAMVGAMIMSSGIALADSWG
jgi:hypothetical protein